MTLDENLEELTIAMYCDKNNSEVSLLTDNLPTTNPTFLKNSACDETHTMSFQNIFAANCLDNIIQHQCARVAREIIKKIQEYGNDAKECLAKHLCCAIA